MIGTSFNVYPVATARMRELISELKENEENNINEGDDSAGS